MMNIQKNENGFSLIEVLVAAAIMGGLSLVFMRFMDLERKMTKTANVNNSLAQVSTLVSGLMANKSICEGNLFTVPPETEYDMSNSSDSFIIDAGNNSVRPILTLGQSFGSSGIILSKAKLELMDNQVIGTPTPAKLVLTFNKDSGSKRTTLGGATVSRSFYVLGHFCENTLHIYSSSESQHEADAQTICESNHGGASNSYVHDLRSEGAGNYSVTCLHSCSPTTPLSVCE